MKESSHRILEGIDTCKRVGANNNGYIWVFFDQVQGPAHCYAFSCKDRCLNIDAEQLCPMEYRAEPWFSCGDSFFHLGAICINCIDNYWLQRRPMVQLEPAISITH